MKKKEMARIKKNNYCRVWNIFLKIYLGQSANKVYIFFFFLTLFWKEARLLERKGILCCKNTNGQRPEGQTDFPGRNFRDAAWLQEEEKSHTATAAAE